MAMHPLSLRLLGPGVEEAFHQDASVCRALSLFDLIGLTQALVINSRMAHIFKLPMSQELPALLRYALLLFISAAVLQMLLMWAAPQQYRRHRRTSAYANRLLRLAIIVVSACLGTPQGQSFQQLVLFRSTEGPTAAAAAAARVGFPANSSAVSGHDGGLPGRLLTAYHAACGSRCRTFAAVFIAPPFLHYAPCHFLLSFRHVVLVQAITFVSSVALERCRLCTTLLLRPDMVDVAQSACSHLSQLAAAATHLLAWDLPASTRVMHESSQALCADPLAAVLLVRTWVDLCMLVLLPLVWTFSVERSLKTSFLHNQRLAEPAALQHDSSGAPGAAPEPSSSPSSSSAVPAGVAARRQQPLAIAATSSTATGSSSSSNRRQQQQPQQQHSADGGRPSGPRSVAAESAPHAEELQQLLLELGASAEAAAAARPPSSASLGFAVILSTVVVVSLVLFWYACEAGVTLLLHVGQRRALECDTDGGWLVLRRL